MMAQCIHWVIVIFACALRRSQTHIPSSCADITLNYEGKFTACASMNAILPLHSSSRALLFGIRIKPAFACVYIKERRSASSFQPSTAHRHTLAHLKANLRLSTIALAVATMSSMAKAQVDRELSSLPSVLSIMMLETCKLTYLALQRGSSTFASTTSASRHSLISRSAFVTSKEAASTNACTITRAPSRVASRRS